MQFGHEVADDSPLIKPLSICQPADLIGNHRPAVYAAKPGLKINKDETQNWIFSNQSNGIAGLADNSYNLNPDVESGTTMGDL